NRNMTQQAPTRAERRSRPKCSKCGATMKLFGIEAHPTIDRTDLLTYVCSHCDGLETETVPHATSKRFPKKGMVMPMNLLLANKAFDTETTQLLGSAFDAAWETVKASNGPLLTSGTWPRCANCSPNSLSRRSSKAREIPIDLLRRPYFA